MNTQEKAKEIIKRLKMEYPELKTALNFKNPFELLVATVLSAQTTDIHVNKVTENLFNKYKTIRDYANVSLETLQKDVSSINFYRTKAKNIHESAKIIIKKALAEMFSPKSAEKIRLLYGGSVKSSCAEQVCLDPAMDGALVGRESLMPYEFVKIASLIDEN